MNDTPEQSPNLTLTFAPIEAALLKAFATRTNAAKPLASLRPLVWFAWLALAQCFGLAHLITPEMRQVALDLARRPGRRKADVDGQSSLLDLFPLNDGRPGIYVSFARLAFGNVREQQGDAVLDLVGITDPHEALKRAIMLGWVGGPSGNGLRFIPPTIWSLVVDHNSAAFARKGGVDEYIESLLSELSTAKERITLLETSIAESARLPIVESTKATCLHKSVVLHDGKRNCTACGASLPEPTNEKVVGFRKKSHAVLTANEEPRDPPPTKTSKTKNTKASSKKKGSRQ